MSNPTGADESFDTNEGFTETSGNTSTPNSTNNVGRQNNSATSTHSNPSSTHVSLPSSTEVLPGAYSERSSSEADRIRDIKTRSFGTATPASGNGSHPKQQQGQQQSPQQEMYATGQSEEHKTPGATTMNDFDRRIREKINNEQHEANKNRSNGAVVCSAEEIDRRITEKQRAFGAASVPSAPLTATSTKNQTVQTHSGSAQDPAHAKILQSQQQSQQLQKPPAAQQQNLDDDVALMKQKISSQFSGGANPSVGTTVGANPVTTLTSSISKSELLSRLGGNNLHGSNHRTQLPPISHEQQPNVSISKVINNDSSYEDGPAGGTSFSPQNCKTDSSARYLDGYQQKPQEQARQRDELECPLQPTNAMNSSLMKKDMIGQDGEISGLGGDAFGLDAAGDDENLAVAVPVNEDDDDFVIDEMHLPAAIEFDPDQKNTQIDNKRRRTMRMLIVITFVILVVIGVTLGIVLSKNSSEPVTMEVNPRTQLGIEQSISVQWFLNVKSSDADEDITDVRSPYRKALDWILYDDPLQLTLANETIFRRFLMAYFYFATSTGYHWRYCAPLPKEIGPNPTPRAVIEKKDVEGVTPCEVAVILRSGRRGGSILEFPVSAKHWFMEHDECSWAGVTCDRSRHVSLLDLGGMNMSGTLHNTLNRFPFLVKVDVRLGTLRNMLSDTDTNDIKHLQSLYTSFNVNSPSPLPRNLLTDTRNLIDLQARSNQLTGTLPDKLSNVMKTIDLTTNSLEGTIPDEFIHTQHVYDLRIEENKFIGTIPSDWFTQKYLTYLYASSNNFTGSIPSTINLTSVIDLVLSSNSLTGTLPESIFTTNLSQLAVSNNLLSGTISTSIGNSPNLWYLYLDNNYFNGSFPDSINSSQNILEISLAGNQFTGSVPSTLCVSAGIMDIVKADCIGQSPYTLNCASGCCSVCCDHDTGECVDMTV